MNLSKCGLGENVDILSAVLSGCKGLKSLLLEGNGNQYRRGAMALLAKYVSSKVLLSLAFSIADNHFGDANAEILYKALDKNKKLREIARNRISMSKLLLGSKQIAANLTHLDLTGAWYWPRSANDRIGVKGATQG